MPGPAFSLRIDPSEIAAMKDYQAAAVAATVEIKKAQDEAKKLEKAGAAIDKQFRLPNGATFANPMSGSAEIDKRIQRLKELKSFAESAQREEARAKSAAANRTD